MHYIRSKDNALTREPLTSFTRASFFGLISLLAWVYLSSVSQDSDQTNVVQLWSVVGVCSLCWSYLYWRSDAAILNKKTVLLWALLFRLAGMCAYPPLEDDWYRYLWDGFITVEHGNPYAFAPSYYFDAEHTPEFMQQILSGVNYPDIATVYGPFTQLAFAGAYLISPGSVLALKTVLLCFEIVLIGAIYHRLDAKQLLLLTWCPLMVFSTSFSAHSEIIGLSLTVLALLLASRHPFIAGCVIALAIGAKVFALLMLPWVIRKSVLAGFGCVITLIILGAPFGFMSSWFPEGLKVMASAWQFNAPVYFLVSGLPCARWLLMAIFALVYAACLFRQKRRDQQSALSAGAGIYGAFLILGTVINPWYWCWLLPFAALTSQVRVKPLWPWVGSVAVFLAYGTVQNLGVDSIAQHSIPLGLLVLEFGLIALAFAWDCLRSSEPVENGANSA